MSTLKRFAKYILIIIGVYLLTFFLIFVSLNSGYSNISLKGEIPEQISIEKAEATKTNGRVYGYISNEKGNNVNDKYLKISVYNYSSELLTTKYLKIDGIKYGERKLFTARFNAKETNSYSISIVDEKK